MSAVNAALHVQCRLRDHTRISLRIGVHDGGIIRDEQDLYSDGINIATRLENLAPEGGIMISDAVYASLDDTLSPSSEATGAQPLNNIARPVTAWVRDQNQYAAQPGTVLQHPSSALPLLNIRPTGNSDTRAEVQDAADTLTAGLGTYFGSIKWLQARINGNDSAPGCHLRPTFRAQGER